MHKKSFAAPYLVWMVIFIIVPLLFIAYYAFTGEETGTFTFENIAAIARPEHLKALWLSLLLSAISTIICLVLSYPLAMILDKIKMNKTSFMVFIFILPMWMNSLLRLLAWQALLENNGVINTLLVTLGLPRLQLINTPIAIVFGMVYNYLPFMILPIYNSFARIDKDIVNAASDLGANGRKTFFKIIFPLTFPGVISGIIMVFIPALTTFAISDLLGGGKILLIGNVIEQEFKFADNWYLGSGLSLVLMFFILISMFLMNKYDKDGEGVMF